MFCILELMSLRKNKSRIYGFIMLFACAALLLDPLLRDVVVCVRVVFVSKLLEALLSW